MATIISKGSKSSGGGEVHWSFSGQEPAPSTTVSEHPKVWDKLEQCWVDAPTRQQQTPQRGYCASDNHLSSSDFKADWSGKRSVGLYTPRQEDAVDLPAAGSAPHHRRTTPIIGQVDGTPIMADTGKKAFPPTPYGAHSSSTSTSPSSAALGSPSENHSRRDSFGSEAGQGFMHKRHLAPPGGASSIVLG